MNEWMNELITKSTSAWYTGKEGWMIGRIKEWKEEWKNEWIN